MSSARFHVLDTLLCYTFLLGDDCGLSDRAGDCGVQWVRQAAIAQTVNDTKGNATHINETGPELPSFLRTHFPHKPRDRAHQRLKRSATFQ